MTLLQILSDYLQVRSDEYRRFAHIRAAQTAPQTCARPTPARAGAARLTDRDLQALRPAKLSLRQRPGARAEAISGDQPAEWASPQRLRAQCALSKVAELLDNFHRLRTALNEICSINAELLRRREEIE